ncbi:hypothetical protein [Streptomyces virginiae]
MNADQDVVVLLTALVRGLATSLLPDIDTGRPPPDFRDPSLHAAHALAGRRGLAGECLDPARGEYVPALMPAERLMERAAPGPASTGDLDLAEELFDRVRRSGGAAARQRTAHLRRGRLTDVVSEPVCTTAAA